MAEIDFTSGETNGDVMDASQSGSRNNTASMNNNDIAGNGTVWTGENISLGDEKSSAENDTGRETGNESRIHESGIQVDYVGINMTGNGKITKGDDMGWQR